VIWTQMSNKLSQKNSSLYIPESVKISQKEVEVEENKVNLFGLTFFQLESEWKKKAKSKWNKKLKQHVWNLTSKKTEKTNEETDIENKQT
jgi:hypothetical protein